MVEETAAVEAEETLAREQKAALIARLHDARRKLKSMRGAEELERWLRDESV